jgi:hypothetical protein
MHAKPLLRAMAVIEEASVSVTCWRDSGFKNWYDVEGSGSFAVEKKLD